MSAIHQVRNIVSRHPAARQAVVELLDLLQARHDSPEVLRYYREATKKEATMKLTHDQEKALSAAGIDWKAILGGLLKLLLVLFGDQPKAASGTKALAMTLSKDEFKTKALAMLSVAGLLASFTPTPKDDAAVALLTHLFTDTEHFDQLCVLLGIS